ncbi:hypothetical protein ACOSQ4_020205 [Xanthoceras sorbifolium]
MGSEDRFEGPWGGQDGRDWVYKPLSGIVEITIRYGDVIDSLSFKNTFAINWPSEYLTSISGTHIIYNRHRVIVTLCFTTNYGNTHKVYGSKKDHGTSESFEFSLKDRVIVGFFERQGNFFDAIGVHYKDPPRSIVTSKVNTEITMAMDLPRDVGPWGGNKGKSWDYGIFGGLSQIEVHVGNRVIHAIQCRYQNRDGNSVWSNLQGGGGASTMYKVRYGILLSS